MKIAITGGAGFLGLHLALGFRRHGHSVRLLDIAPLIEEDFEGDLPEYVECDVRDAEALKTALDGVDAVAGRRQLRAVGGDGDREVLEPVRHVADLGRVDRTRHRLLGLPRDHRRELVETVVDRVEVGEPALDALDPVVALHYE